MITGAQIEAARKLLRWPPSTLAAKAKLPISVISRAEKSTGEPVISITQLDALLRTLRAAGVEFIPQNGEGPGVRLRAPSAE